jgi:hypothetical protein
MNAACFRFWSVGLFPDDWSFRCGIIRVAFFDVIAVLPRGREVVATANSVSLASVSRLQTGIVCS